MKRVITAAIVLAVAACVSPPLCPLAAQTPERAAFLLRSPTDTLVIERFRHVGDTIQGSIAVKGQPRIAYHTVLAADSTITVSIDVFAAGSGTDAAPAQHLLVTLHHDSALVAAGPASRSFAITPGALPLLNNSFAMGELFTTAARRTGDSADIPVWAFTGGANLVVHVRPISHDSVTLAIANQIERLAIDPAGHILGGTLPAQSITIDRLSAERAATIQFGKPDYSAPPGAPYSAIDVHLEGQGGIPLGGTLTMPDSVAGPVPAVVTITGSGQEDRDEYLSMVPGGYRIFRQIADTLSRRGIAVLRLDDRTIGESGGEPGTSADYADDIRAALAWLRARPGIDGSRLALVGHSEGGMIAPMVAATDSTLNGIVLLAGPARNGLDILHFQQRQAIEQDSTIPPAARDSAVRAMSVALDSLVKTNAWLRFFITYDPLATARRVRVPVLILQGATDHQVTPDQAGMLARAFRGGGDSDVTVHTFPALDHLFLPDTSGLPSGYLRLKDNHVPPAVLGTVADWLVARLGVKQ